MNRLILLVIFIFTISLRSGLCEVVHDQDTLRENQILYNGTVWINLFYRVRGEQFLFSKDLLPGSVTISGKTFKNIRLRYDIYNDEISTPTNNGFILQLNKEKVDSFTLDFQNKTFKFRNIQKDSITGFKGFVHVLNSGNTALFVKYKKEIQRLAVENKYDLFYQTHRIYLVKDNVVYLITSKRELLKYLADYKLEIRSFIKKNRLRFTKKDPESFVPVIQFYNSLRK